MKHILCLTLVLLVAACAGGPPHGLPTIERSGCTYLDDGYASWYGNEMAIGKKNGKYIFNPTASGERFEPEGITAAHRTLPFGTMVKVVLDKPGANPDGIMVRINDRGPFVRGRIIDLSRGASRALNMPDTQKVIIYTCQ